jgi:hypothetical protein
MAALPDEVKSLAKTLGFWRDDQEDRRAQAPAKASGFAFKRLHR